MIVNLPAPLPPRSLAHARLVELLLLLLPLLGLLSHPLLRPTGFLSSLLLLQVLVQQHCAARKCRGRLVGELPLPLPPSQTPWYSTLITFFHPRCAPYSTCLLHPHSPRSRYSRRHGMVWGLDSARAIERACCP